MDKYDIKTDSKIRGIYLSSETIDLIQIVKCNELDELKDFIINCEQIDKKDKQILEKETNVEELKKYFFEKYKDSFISTEQSITDPVSLIKRKLEHVGIDENDIQRYIGIIATKGIAGIQETIYQEQPENYSDFCKGQHRFLAKERDQIKSVTYEEIEGLSKLLDEHNTVLLGSGKYCAILNAMHDEEKGVPKYDFYHIKKELDFCKENNMYARYHTLLDQTTLEGNFAGNTKEEVISNLSEYVKQSIDLINEYNENNKINGKGGIVSVDLFNEIISFDPPYVNIWEEKYGINMQELMQVYQYALDNKPEGVTYVYNEPFLEDADRRKAVMEMLDEIEKISPGLIDTLGTQMHIQTDYDREDVEECFKDFKALQEKGYGIQITELDICLSEKDIFDENGNIKQINKEDKQKAMADLQHIINKSGVELEGLTYWSATDTLDHNVERTNTNTFLAKDFYDKFRKLEKGEMALDSLMKHPFLSGQKAEDFAKMYKDGRVDELEKSISSEQREVITTRLSGLYSGIDISKDKIQPVEKETKNKSILDSAIEATEQSTRTGEIQYQTKTINEVHRDRQMGEQSHEKTRSYSSNSNMQK